MARGTKSRPPAWTWISCAFLFVTCPPGRAGEARRNDERGFTFYEFAGDLFHPWSDAAPYPSTS